MLEHMVQKEQREHRGPREGQVLVEVSLLAACGLAEAATHSNQNHMPSFGLTTGEQVQVRSKWVKWGLTEQARETPGPAVQHSASQSAPR